MSEQAQTDEAAPEPERTWPFVLKLKHPVTDLTGELVSEIKFRRGKMGDLKGMNLRLQVPVNDLVLIASRMSGQTTDVLEMLDGEDAGEVMSIALDFYGQFLRIGMMR